MRRLWKPVLLAGAIVLLAGLAVLVGSDRSVFSVGASQPPRSQPTPRSPPDPGPTPAGPADEPESEVAPSPLASLSDEELELPPADAAEARETLDYLRGPGRDLAVLHDTADRVARTDRLDPQRCREFGDDLVDAAGPREMIELTADVDDEVVRGGLQAQTRALTMLFDLCVHGEAGSGPDFDERPELDEQHDRVIEINDLIRRRLTSLEQVSTP